MEDISFGQNANEDGEEGNNQAEPGEYLHEGALDVLCNDSASHNQMHRMAGATRVTRTDRIYRGSAAVEVEGICRHVSPVQDRSALEYASEALSVARFDSQSSEIRRTLDHPPQGIPPKPWEG